MPTQCFLVKPASDLDCFLWLRRYANQDNNKCSLPDKYHHAWVPIGVIKAGYRWTSGNSDGGKWLEHNFTEIPHEDSRWPAACACGYQFVADDNWQNFTDRMYQAEDSRQWPRRELPPGAMFYEDWLPYRMWWDNQSGQHLSVILPNGSQWNIDSRASNCTLPNDRLHRCWIRHGEPPNVTVDKSGGSTCAAGAGSILSGSYHGFLRSGMLEP